MKKFLPRRGRVNCSLNDNGKWRWFGTQFTSLKIKSNFQAQYLMEVI